MQTTQLNGLTINKLTKAQYDGIASPSSSELYFVTDDVGIYGGTGITVDGDTVNHSNNVTAKTTYVDTATTLSANGGKLKITDIKYDAQGHITGSQDRTITLSQTTYTVNNVALKVASNSGTATQVTTMNDSTARTLTLNGDNTWIKGAVSGSSNAAVVTFSHDGPGTGSALTTSNGTSSAYAIDTEYEVLTGVTVSADSKGHITGVSTTRQKIKDTNNKVTQNSVIGTNDTFRILLQKTDVTTAETDTVNKAQYFYFNPSNSTLTVGNTAGVINVAGSSGTLTITSKSTLWLDKAAGSSLIFRNGTTEYARFTATHANLNIGATATADQTQNNFKLLVNGKIKTQNTTDATASDTADASAAALTIAGGAQIAKTLAAKSIIIDNNATTNCTLQYDENLQTLKFVFA